MTGSSQSGNTPPRPINILSSHVTQHGQMTLENSPHGVRMSWPAPADTDLAATSEHMGVNNLFLNTTKDDATGETTSIASTQFTHEEYEAYRTSPQGKMQ